MLPPLFHNDCLYIDDQARCVVAQCMENFPRDGRLQTSFMIY